MSGRGDVSIASLVLPYLYQGEHSFVGLSAEANSSLHHNSWMLCIASAEVTQECKVAERHVYKKFVRAASIGSLSDIGRPAYGMSRYPCREATLAPKAFKGSHHINVDASLPLNPLKTAADDELGQSIKSASCGVETLILASRFAPEKDTERRSR